MSKVQKHQINIRIEQELYDFLFKRAKENYKTVTAIVRELIAKEFKEHNALPTTRD